MLRWNRLCADAVSEALWLADDKSSPMSATYDTLKPLYVRYF